MRIDAHQHFWRLERGDYGWLTPAAGSLYRDYLPHELEPILARHDIDATILVQAAPTVAETEYMLSLAAEHDFIAGVVGWLDLTSPDFARDYERLRRNPRFVSIRPMLQDLPDAAWIARPEVIKSLERLAADGFPIDFLAKPSHLGPLIRVMERLPQLRGIVDHIAKPDIAAGAWQPWADDLARLAQFPTVYCKLSGMVTEAGAGWTADKLAPYAQHALEQFGWSRVVFGSDWPVCTLAASYDEVVDGLKSALGGLLTPEHEDALFGGNAARFYGVQ